MTRLRDSDLAAHLARRAGVRGTEPERDRDARLHTAVAARLAAEPQGAPWRPGLRGARTPALAATLALLFVALVRVWLPPSGPLSSGGPPDVRLLSVDELARLVSSVSAPGNAERVVVVDANVAEAAFRCRFGFSCPIGRIEGSVPEILVYADDMAGKILPTSSPVAVRIRGPNEVDLVGHVRTESSGDIVWRLPEVIPELERLEGVDRGVPAERVVPALFVIDAWISTIATPPSCPAPMPDENGNPREWGPFGCGGVAWLGPDDTQPNIVVVDGETTSYSFDVPNGGIRVQNGAYFSFAPGANQPRSEIALPPPQRAAFLVRPMFVEPNLCFFCTRHFAEIVARLDPVEIRADPSTTSTPVEASRTPVVTASELPTVVTILTASEVSDLAKVEDAIGRVVVADVEFRTDITFDCEPPCPVGYLAGTDPMVVVRSVPAWLRDEKPVALRILGDRLVDVLGNVVPPGSGRAWTMPEFLGTLPPRGSENGLYPVDGWLSHGFTAPPCPAPTEPTPPPGYDYGCGPTAWLGPSDARSDHNEAPIGAVRVQNGAYPAFAALPGGEPSRAVYLVEWLLCITLQNEGFECPDGRLLHLVARIDSIEIPQSTATPLQPIGSVSIRTIFDDPIWAGDPVLDDDVVLCRGASDCGSANELYPGVNAPPSDVDFSRETMLRVVGGIPQSATWDGSVLELLIADRSAGFWEGAIGIDLGDVPAFRLSTVYVVCAIEGGCP